MTDPLPAPSGLPSDEETEFRRGLGLFDATMVVVGAMIGSGIFVVSADMSRLVGSPGWLLVAWLVTGVLTVAAALSYGELAAMMPHAGGQYIFLREAFSPLWGFLYGWTLILVIQSGTIAAVGVAFARFAGVLFPEIAETNYLVEPWHFSQGYALSLSKAQLVAIAMIAILTAANLCGVNCGRIIQNVFTVARTGARFAPVRVDQKRAKRLCRNGLAQDPVSRYGSRRNGRGPDDLDLRLQQRADSCWSPRVVRNGP